MRSARFTLIFVLLLPCLQGCTRTTLKLFSSDTDSVAHIRLEEYNLREVKRGLFLGICPSTSQIQWSYYIHLAGPGPAYSPEQVKLEEGGSGDKLKITSGQIHLDHLNRTMSISLRVEEKGVTNTFAHNGTFAIENPK